MWYFVGLLVLYWIGIIYLGFFLSSAGFLLGAMYLLGVHNMRIACLVTFAWLVFAFLGFGRLLGVPLPMGRLFESAF